MLFINNITIFFLLYIFISVNIISVNVISINIISVKTNVVRTRRHSNIYNIIYIKKI
jgi:hypothetical protein